MIKRMKEMAQEQKMIEEKEKEMAEMQEIEQNFLHNPDLRLNMTYFLKKYDQQIK